jgi:hypothetical protein
MKNIQIILIFLLAIYSCSCVTWVREETDDKITQGMVGAIIETKQASRICISPSSELTQLCTGYFVFPYKFNNLPEDTYVAEDCPSGTRGRVIRFIKERDASQHIWNYVEFEMDDPRLKQKYRIIRMTGLRGKDQNLPWHESRDFRVVSKMNN